MYIFIYIYIYIYLYLYIYIFLNFINLIQPKSSKLSLEGSGRFEWVFGTLDFMNAESRANKYQTKGEGIC